MHTYKLSSHYSLSLLNVYVNEIIETGECKMKYAETYGEPSQIFKMGFSCKNR